jgi:ADP-ribosyl-[dinitrogen reductase] hydrolase
MNKIATLTGLCIGDALGKAFEMFSPYNEKLLNWDGLFKEGGTFHFGKENEYTDDGKMSICLATSLVDKGGFDIESVANCYLDWYNSQDLRGIGSTTAKALLHLKLGSSPYESGLTDPKCAGNGSAMRVAPIGIFYRNELDNLIKFAMEDASITHNSLEPKIGSVAVGLGVALIANKTHDNKNIISELENVLVESEVLKKIQTAKQCLWEDLPWQESLSVIGTSGFVADTVGAAFYCFAATNSFKDAVVMAVRGGGDTDTIAAITGALAGTYYGLSGIPEEYKSVEDYDLLDSLTDELMEGKLDRF